MEIELTSMTQRKDKEKLESPIDSFDSSWNMDNSEVFSENLHTVSRLRQISKEGFDYSGILYTNRLRASQTINLRSLGFFGPSSKGIACYLIDIEIEEEFFQSNAPPQKIISIKKQAVNAEMDEIFFYNFPTSHVILQANKWYSIKFQLDGPKTCTGTKHLSNERAGNVEFDFHYGSSQMPQIQFTTI